MTPHQTHAKEPISIEHRCPSPNKDQPKFFKDKKTDALDFESSSCSETFKPFDDYMPITERQLSVSPRITRIENTQPTIQSDLPSLKTDTFEIKAMITEIFYAFKGQPFSTPSSSVPKITLAVTKGSITVRGRLIDLIILVQVPQPKNPSHTTPKPNRGKDIARDTNESPRKLVPASEEKATQEAKLLALSKPELIKVVHEVAKEAGVDLKALQSSKGGQEFIKKQDAKLNVLKRECLEKLTKAKKLRKKRIDQYKWIISSRLKFEKITDIHIHPNTKPIAIKDELGAIIPKNKNKVVEDLMTSLSKKYDRLKVIPGELGINLTFLTPKQVPSLTSCRKRKAQELEPKSFQRMSDIHKVDIDTLLSYSVMDSNINTPANKRLCAVMRSMIESHPDKEKLKSKKVK
ncbi:hypothetical protein Tco_0968788 [Tanacetum coccineum]